MIFQKVYLSTRSGAWCNNRVSFFGLPLDMLFGSRFFAWTEKYLGFWLLNFILESMANIRFCHAIYGLKCRHRWSAQHPTVNDELPNRIISGQIVVKPNVRKFHDYSIEFDDGSIVDNIDTVFLCTGYNIGFPMVQKEIIQVDQNRIDCLYKNIFPKTLDKPTLFVIGLVQPVGAVAPISEMQSRVCCEVLSGNVNLPGKSIINAQIERDNNAVYDRYMKSRRHTIQVDYVPYMEHLAQMIDVRPKIWPTLFTDPLLWTNFILGPAAPYQYRIRGPGRWPEAAETQKLVWKRTMHGLTKVNRQITDEGSNYLVKIIVILLLIIVVLIFGLIY